MVTGWLWERERSKMTLRFSIWVTGKRRGHLLRWQALKEDHFSGDSVGNLWELLEEMFIANTQCPGKQIVGQKTACSNFVSYHLESNIEVPQRGKPIHGRCWQHLTMCQRTPPVTQKALQFLNPRSPDEEVEICWDVHISSWAKVKWIGGWITKSEDMGCTVPCFKWHGRRPRKLNTWLLPPPPETSTMIRNNSFKLPRSSESSMAQSLVIPF